MNKKDKINILVTLDENYIPYMNVMLFSLLHSNPDCYFDIYLLHTSIPDDAVNETRNIIGKSGNLIMVSAKDIGLDIAPTTSRYPQEIYYRILFLKVFFEEIWGLSCYIFNNFVTI